MNDLCQPITTGLSKQSTSNTSTCRFGEICLVQTELARRPSDSRLAIRIAFDIAILLATFAFTVCQSAAIGQDWPQINGPDRNGVAKQESLIKNWPDDGPRQIWKHPVGQGFSGPVVKDNQLVIFHRPGRDYLVETLAADSGKPIWNRELPCVYQGGGPDGDKGPKAAPLIHDGHVYLFGTGGNLFCLSMTDGKLVWKKNMLEIYKSPTGYFGSGSTPIVVANRLLLNVGGDNAAVVALDVKTGEEIWKSFDDRASYSSPVEIEIDGKSVVVFVTRLHLLGLDPRDGSVQFKTRFGKTGPTVNGALPVFVDNHLFINSAYGVGARWINTAGGNLKEIWSNDNSFSSQYSTPIYMDDHLFGTAGREDRQNGSFRCVEASTGIVKWSQKSFPVGHTILVDGKLLVLDCKGVLHLIEPDVEEFVELQTAKILPGPGRSLPAFSNGRLYARSNASGSTGELGCYQLGESKPSD